ncbi:MAG: hypothetical protein ACK4K0_02470 [Flavobacteriales bacterium]
MSLVFYILLSFSFTSVSLNSVRDTYFDAEGKKEKIIELKSLTSAASVEKEPVMYGYNGVATAMWAEFEFNPLSKLSTFKKGKEKLEKAIEKAPDNVELRFLRFSVQTKAPSIAGYNSNIKSDKTFIINNLSKAKSKTLSNNYCLKVVDFLLNSELCTEEEKKKLKSI